MVTHPRRGAPLVATWTRWAAGVVVVTVGFVVAIQPYVVISHSGPASFLAPLGLAPLVAVFAVLPPVLWVVLRAEEQCLARELRIARTGTAALRATVAKRRHGLVATKLGRAAVSLADGDRAGARGACAGGSPLMRGGRLEKLRDVVEADLERASGTPAGLDHCVQRLLPMPRIGNREADLYRVHVLAKALLERGDASGALDLAQTLEASGDDEERLYRTWLRAWFDLETAAPEDAPPWAPLPEGELRMATLLARAHGADQLVQKLEGRVAAIARPTEGV